MARSRATAPVRRPAFLILLAAFAGLPAADALAAPFLGHGVATQGSRDRMEDHRPFVETACPTAGTLHRVTVTLTHGAAGDELAVVFKQDAAPTGVARVAPGETVVVYAFKGHCGVEDAFVIEGAVVETVALYEVEISEGCYLSAEDCERHFWD